MSEEVFLIVNQLNRDSLETQIALRCAPLITGIKMSNLLTVSAHHSAEVRRIFEGSGISCCTLYVSQQKVTFLLYRREWLERWLMQRETAAMMHEFGYRIMSLHHIFQELSRRYALYMERYGAFPHEIGLLLGYPPEDVSGFIRNQGKNFLYSGYWKVYANAARTIRLFEQYDKATERMIRQVSRGISIQKLIKSQKFQEVSA